MYKKCSTCSSPFQYSTGEIYFLTQNPFIVEDISGFSKRLYSLQGNKIIKGKINDPVVLLENCCDSKNDPFKKIKALYKKDIILLGVNDIKRQNVKNS